MAKRAFDIDDILSAQPDTPKRRDRAEMGGAMIAQGTGRGDVAAAKGQRVVGNRRRKTIYLPPELIEEIDREAKEAGYPVMDFYDWLVRRAYADYKDGRIQPEVTEEVRTVRALKLD